MNNASINLTIDLVAFQKSLTAAFSMFDAMVVAMGQKSPKTLQELNGELDNIAAKVARPMILQANGAPFISEAQQAGRQVDNLTDKVEKSHLSLKEWFAKNRESMANVSLVYSGFMNVYNDVTRIFGGMIRQQVEAEQGMARVTAAVKSTGNAAGFTAEQLKAMADGMEGSLAIDADEIMNKVTTPLLTFSQVSGEVFKEAQLQIMNMSRGLGTDLQGAAMQVGKALQDPVEGLTALRRSGVSFSDEQQQVIQDLYETGRAAEAQRMILAELNKEFGGQAAAFAETGGGKLAALKVSFDNLSESIGGLLLPVLTGLGEAIKPLVEWFTGLDGVFKVLIPSLVLATGAWYKLSAAQVVAGATSGTLAGAISAASLAVKGFLTTIGPVGWVLMGVTAAFTAYSVVTGKASTSTTELGEAQKSVKERMDDAQTAVDTETTKFSLLANKLLEIKSKTDQTTESKSEMQNVIASLNKDYGAYLQNIDLETASYNDLATALNKASDALIGKKIAEVYGAEYQKQVQTVAQLTVQLQKLKPEQDALLKRQQDFLKAMPKGAMSDENPMGFNPTTYFGNDNDYAKVETRLNEIGALTGRLQAAKSELLEIAIAYKNAMQDIPDLQLGGANAGSGGGTGAAAAVNTELEDYKRLAAELAAARKSETERLEAEYLKRLALIQKYTADGSAEEKQQLEDLDAWKKQREDEITATETRGMQDKFQKEVDYLSNLQEMGVSSYDQLAAKMKEYYAWASANLPAEEAALVLKQLREVNLRRGEAEKERKDKEIALQRELQDIRDEYGELGLSAEEADLQAELTALERNFEDRKAKMLEAGLTEEQIAKMFADRKAKLIQESNDKIVMSNTQVVQNAAGSMSKIFGAIGDMANKESKKGFETWKAMALAQGYVDTFAAAIGAYCSMSRINPILAIEAAAAAMAAGMANIMKIQATKYEPPHAATGGLLSGPSHAQGGILIEAEGDEYITNKQRVKDVGTKFFDFINFAPIGAVRQALGNIAWPEMKVPAYALNGGYANGGSVKGGIDSVVDGLREEIRELKAAILGNKPVFKIEVDPLANHPVRITELNELGAQIRGGI